MSRKRGNRDPNDHGCCHDHGPDSSPDEMAAEGFSRRAFIKGASLTIASVGIAGSAGAVPGLAQDVPVVGPGSVKLQLTVNGKAVEVDAQPSTTLLDLVRQQLDLTGAKRVCDHGACGACTMIVDGKTVNSCGMLAIDAIGKEITTVEGIGQPGNMSPVQKAFADCDATQCGFCTPGMVVACTALLSRNSKPSKEDVAEAISGNLCRCGTYQNIFEAMEQVKKGGRRAGF